MGVTTPLVWTGAKQNSKPSDTVWESGARPIITCGGGAFMSAGLTWEWVPQPIIGALQWEDVGNINFLLRSD